jgi:putative tryptophan/tyrosine transport system substrate-binding protein
MICRREFILGVSAVAAWPVAALAQQRSLPVIGFLHSASLETRRGVVAAFNHGLSEFGFVEGQNLAIEYRWANDHLDRLPALASELVLRPVAVIAAIGAPAAIAAKASTAAIPIVFQTGAEPIGLGLIASLNRPGGNITGVSNISSELNAKRLQLLHELAPSAKLIAMLVNPENPPIANSISREFPEEARQLGLQADILRASTTGDIDAAFETIANHGVGALVVGADTFFVGRRDQLATLAARHSIPTIYEFREFAAAGGLISYGASIPDLLRQVGVYTGKILKGAKPADLPVLQPTKFEMVINLKTAKALGLSIPPGILAIADEVIE